MLFHIQVVVYGLVIISLIISQSALWLVVLSPVALLVSPFLINYAFYQGISYINNPDFGFRATGLIWILFDLTILYSHFGRIPFPKAYFKPLAILVTSHLFINIIFIFNSHISGRISKPFEPIIMLLFVVAASNNIKQKNMVWIILIIPALTYYSFVLSL